MRSYLYFIYNLQFVVNNNNSKPHYYHTIYVLHLERTLKYHRPTSYSMSLRTCETTLVHNVPLTRCNVFIHQSYILLTSKSIKRTSQHTCMNVGIFHCVGLIFRA